MKFLILLFIPFQVFASETTFTCEDYPISNLNIVNIYVVNENGFGTRKTCYRIDNTCHLYSNIQCDVQLSGAKNISVSGKCTWVSSGGFTQYVPREKTKFGIRHDVYQNGFEMISRTTYCHRN